MNSPAPIVLGTARLAGEHVRALLSLGITPSLVVGRDAEKARQFGEQFGVRCQGGSAENLGRKDMPSTAIIAVSHEELAKCTLIALKFGCRSILLEKPGATSLQELSDLASAAKARGARIYIGYNRRFYPTVTELRRRAAAEGGLRSCHFEFTEWEKSLLTGEFSAESLAIWGIVNSSHVIDLALFLCGEFSEISTVVNGGLPWHPSGSQFAGTGKTQSGAVLSYHSNWESAGSWRLECSTPQNRYLLAPMERLQVQPKYELSYQPVTLPAIDPQHEGIKMGIREQMEAFLSAAAGEPVDPRLMPLDDQIARWALYARIFGYKR